MRIEQLRLPLGRAGERVRALAVVRCRQPVQLAAGQLDIRGEERALGWFRRRSVELLQATVRLELPTQLPVGRHELAGEIELPVDLPPTYRGRRVEVRYVITASLTGRQGEQTQRSAALRMARGTHAVGALPPRTFQSEVSAGGVSVAAALVRPYCVPGDNFEIDIALRGSAPARAQVNALVITLTGREHARRELSRFLPRMPSNMHWEESVLGRWSWTLGARDMRDGVPTTVRLRVPQDARPSLDGNSVRCSWALSIRCRGPSTQVQCEQSVLMLAAPPDVVQRPSLDALAHIGEPDAVQRWRDVATQLGLAYQGNRLVGSLGDTHCLVQREHRGDRGVFLVARIAFAPLGIALAVRPQAALHKLVGVTLGWDRFEREHSVGARFAQQARAFLSRLPALASSTLAHVEGDDGGLALFVREAGALADELTQVAAIAREVVAGLAGARSAIPPPPPLETHLPAWRALQARLEDAMLERGPMVVSGSVAGHRCAVRTQWSGAAPCGTDICLWPARAPGASYHVSIDLSRDGRPIEVPQLPRAARGLLDELLDGAQRLTVDASGLVLTLPAPLPDPPRAYERLLGLEKLYRALRPGAGPFR